MSSRMKGLNQFIADIRNCPNKEAESKRVEKELAKIRQKFTSNKALEGYQKKKYVWKLLYMMTLGYDVDFGHSEAATLIAAAKFSEKYTGYVATSVMITERNSDIYQRISQSIRNDLISGTEINQCLALSAIGTIAPKDLVEVVVGDIEKMALKDSGRTSMFVRKKAVLTLLRIYRKFKDRFTIDDGWSASINTMLDQKNLGYLSSVISLLYGIVALNSYVGFEENVPKLIKILYKIVINKDCSSDYLYYHTPNPWLQVKILKSLQLFPPPQDTQLISAISDVLNKIISKTEVTKSVNKNNADHGILFEAVNLIIHYRNTVNSELKNQAISLLGVFISVREPNIRYLALESISKFSNTPNAEALIQEHLKTILTSLRDNDISIRRRALDILYIMCTSSTAPKIVEELLNYSDEHDLQIKEELVLKIAILAEKFADNLIWYIDVVVRLVTNSGDYVTEDIWHRIIQIITGFGKDQNSSLQQYAANKLFSALNVPNVHENLVKIGAYVLSEYGKYIVDQPGKDANKLFEVLNKHWTNCSPNGKAMLLNAYVKMANQYSDLLFEIKTLFEVNSEHWNPDIQQRAVEYLNILKDDDGFGAIRGYVLEKMPTYSEEIQSNNPLLRKILSLKKGAATSDPTVQNSVKKLVEEEMYKSKSFMTGTQINKNLNTIGKETVFLGEEKQSSPTKTNPPPKQQPVKNLMDEDLLGGDDIPVTTSSSITSHVLYKQCQNKIATGGNVVPIPSKLTLPSSNSTEFKALITSDTGVIYEDNYITINFKSSFQPPLAKIAFQFVTKGDSLNKLNFVVQNTSSLLFKTGAIQYGEQHPNVMVEALNIGMSSTPVKVNLSYISGGNNRTSEFSLPILSHKWIQAVEMASDKFDTYFDDYTTSSNDKFWRLDNFINNPAPPDVPLGPVLKKFSAMFTSLNFQIVEGGSPYVVSGVGQFLLKPEGSQTEVKLPTMIQIEGFDNNKQYLRLSLRGAANKDVLKNLYEVIVMFVQP